MNKKKQLTNKVSKDYLKENTDIYLFPKDEVTEKIESVFKNKLKKYTLNKITVQGSFISIEVSIDFDETEDLEFNRFKLIQLSQEVRSDIMSGVNEVLPVVNVSLKKYEIVKGEDKVTLFLSILTSDTDIKEWVTGVRKKKLDEAKKIESDEDLEETIRIGVGDSSNEVRPLGEGVRKEGGDFVVKNNKEQFEILHRLRAKGIEANVIDSNSIRAKWPAKKFKREEIQKMFESSFKNKLMKETEEEYIYYCLYLERNTNKRVFIKIPYSYFGKQDKNGMTITTEKIKNFAVKTGKINPEDKIYNIEETNANTYNKSLSDSNIDPRQSKNDWGLNDLNETTKNKKVQNNNKMKTNKNNTVSLKEVKDILQKLLEKVESNHKKTLKEFTPGENRSIYGKKKITDAEDVLDSIDNDTEKLEEDESEGIIKHTGKAKTVDSYSNVANRIKGTNVPINKSAGKIVYHEAKKKK